MQMRLMGLNGLKNQEQKRREHLRKSVLQAQKEEEMKRKRIEEEREKLERDKYLEAVMSGSSSSSQGEELDDEPGADYFKLRRPKELEELRKQFIHLVQNRSENKDITDFLEGEQQAPSLKKRRSNSCLKSNTKTAIKMKDSAERDSRSTGQQSQQTVKKFACSVENVDEHSALRVLKIEPMES